MAGIKEKYKDDKEKLKEALEKNEKPARKAELLAKENPLMELFIYREEREIHASRFSHKKNQAKGIKMIPINLVGDGNIGKESKRQDIMRGKK